MLHDGETRRPCLTQDITLRCVDENGQSMILSATFGYDAADPFAVSTTFRTQWSEVVWTFARELLFGGLTNPTGDGDVHVWPCLDSEGNAIAIIEFSSPDGELLVQAPGIEISTFLSRTYTQVPAGTESSHVDVDDLIHQLLAV